MRLLAVLLALFPLQVQSVDPASAPALLPPSNGDLPIEKTPWEEANESLFPFEWPADDPPPGPVVSCAEWEPMTGVLIRYPLGIPLGLVAEMSQDVEVKTIVSSTALLQQARTQYLAAGINLANCTWLIAPTNSIYTRDYGPWYIFTGEDSLGIVTKIYNRPTRPDDRRINFVLGDTMDIPVYRMPLNHTGGNYMCDGMGVAMSSDLVYDENASMTPDQVDNMFYHYTGNDYVVMTDPFGGIRHIDCWAKMLDPGRILVKQVDPPNAQLEANVAYLQSLTSSYGRPYEIIRIDNTSTTAYTNALILNTKVLVPTFNIPQDQQALRTWQEAMPGYEIIGFNGGWSSNDALHCRVMGMADRYMLRLVHVPLHDRENNGSGYSVAARVHAYSHQALLPGTPQVGWRVNGGAYASIAMNQIAGDSFSASIPEQPDGSWIEYYLHAEDGSGRSEDHPYIGAGHPHRFFVGPDTLPPTVLFQVPSALLPLQFPLRLTAQVQDDRQVGNVAAELLLNGIPLDTLTMTPQSVYSTVYTATLAGTFHPGDSLSVRVQAVDASQAQNTTYEPPTGYLHIAVLGSATACVWNPCQQNSGNVFSDLLEQHGITSIYMETQPPNFNRFDNLFIFLGVYPYNTVLTIAQVNLISTYMQSGHNIYLEGADCWFYDPTHAQLGQALGIIGVADGGTLGNPLLGVDSTFTAGMSFNYIGQNNYMDRIAAAAGSQMIFCHADTGYGVAHDAGTHRSIGTSFEFSGLVGNNPGSSQELLFQQIMDYFGIELPSVIAGSPAASLTSPDCFRLYPAFPNPFNPATAISYQLAALSHVSLKVYDTAGRLVETLVDGWREAGTHQEVFDGSDLPSGIYIYRLQAGLFTACSKIVLMK